MDNIALVRQIFSAVERIAKGRIGLHTDGQEPEGRISWQDGIARAAAAFTEALASADPLTLILAETAFLEQELEYCDEADTNAQSSLKTAIQSFRDARRSLEAVEDPPIYQGAEKTWPTSGKYRTHGCPRDAYHIACIANRTRLKNDLRVPGMNMTEKAVYEQRAANMGAAQTAYLEKQKSALSR